MHNHLNPLQNSRRSGFTLVELLIAIVVIAILAAISVVAFNGVQDRAKKASLSTALSGTTKRVELDKVTRGSYATALSQIQGSTDSNTSGVEYQYTSDGLAYCLTAILGKFAMHTASNQAEASEGTCEGHDEPDVGPVTDPVVHTQTGSFEARQPEAGGGVNTPIAVNYDVKPSDYVFILFNARYNTVLSLTDANGNVIPSIYERSMGASGYQKHVAFGVDGQTAQQALNIQGCWSLTCQDYNPVVAAAHIVYVVRGLGSSPTFAATYTPYGVQPGHNVTVGPEAHSLAKRKLAIFSYVYYGNQTPAETDASSPGLTWITDSTAPLTGQGTAIASRHTYAESPTSVRYQMTMPSQYSHYHGSVLFTLQ